MSQQPQDDFSQLRNAFNDPVAPAPSFAVDLKERVMQEAAVSSNPTDSRSADITGASLSKAQVIRMPMLAATGWKSAFVTAATVVIVLVLAFGSLRYVIQRDGGGETNHTGQIGIPAASPVTAASDTGIIEPTPELETITARETTDFAPLSAGWGGADRSWDLGPLPAHLDSGIALDEISGSPSGGYGPAQTFGNIIIRQLEGSASNPRSSLQAIDLSAQSVLWTINVATTGRMASDGQRLFAFKYDHAKGAYGLIAIDLLSGNILWQFDDPTSTSEEVDGPGPLVFDGVVYMFDGPQAFYALDAITGEQIWNVTQDRKLTNEINQPITNTTGQNVRTLPPLMAVDDNALYVVTGYQFIEALDRKTGASLWEHEFASPPEEGMLDAAIAIDTGHVYVATQTVRWVLPLVVNQPMLHAYSNAKVIAYDKTSGESVWESEILNFQSTMVFASNHLVLSTGKRLVSLNLSTGDIVTSYDLAVTQESQHQQWLGSSGDTVFIILENGESTTLLRFQIPQIDGAMTRLIGQWDLPEELSRMRLRLPTVSVWNGNLVLIGETGTIGLITRRPAR